MPAQVLFSEYNLGRQFNVSDVWSRWVDPSANLIIQGVGDNKGHFIIEGAPEETIAQLSAFLDRLGVDY